MEHVADDGSELARRLVDVALDSDLRRGLRESPHPPASLRVPGHYGEWQPWQPIPSTVTDDDIEWLQRRVSVPLPGAYLALLRHKHFLNLQVEPVRFFRFIPELWRESFEEEYSGWDPDAVLAARLIPFGHECMADAGPVCFDARVACAEADYPVVFWDHEWVGTEREICPLFSSTSAMFRCLNFVVSRPDGFFHADPTDTVEQTRSKQRDLRTFLELDPAGAGGPGREYFTCWGIEP